MTRLETAKRLSDLLSQKGIAPKDAARRFRTPQTAYKHLSGVRGLDLASAIIWASLLEISVEDLAERIGIGHEVKQRLKAANE